MSETPSTETPNPAALLNSTPAEMLFFYRGVFKFASQYKIILFSILFAIIVQVLYLSSLALIIRKIFDHALPSKNIHLLITMLSIIGTLFIAGTISAILQSLLVTKISSKLIYFFRIQIFRKTNELPKKQLSKTEETESCRRFLGDVSAILIASNY